MATELLAEKWAAFSWDVLVVDGHDPQDLAATFCRARWVQPRGKPIVVIAHTVKGRGIEMAEFTDKWHTHAPETETADAMLRELSRRYCRPELATAGWAKSE